MPKTMRVKFVKGKPVMARGLTKTQVKSVKKIANKVAQGLCEKKNFTWLDENIQLFHNKGDYRTNFLSCKQGVADDQSAATKSNRIGDEIVLKNVNARLWLSNKNDRPNVMYKCYLFWYNTEVTLNDAYCFFTQQNKMLDRINNEAISVIDQKTIFSGPSYSTGVASDAGSAKERSQLCTLNGNWKGKKIKYDEGDSTPKFKTIGLCVVCYDAYGTLQTDNIASYAYNVNVRFIDS